ncbi:hypothetical protein BN1088_1432834 [Sphingobacterium sp. PM2-P1-29]|nr:hypothetical protein BN1088_1432834 [Sphingobacterium sp. PM2-P1-29]
MLSHGFLFAYYFKKHDIKIGVKKTSRTLTFGRLSSAEEGTRTPTPCGARS